MMDLAQIDKISRGSNVGLKEVCLRIRAALGITNAQFSVMQPTVVASASSQTTVPEEIALAVLATMGEIVDRKLTLVFSKEGQGDIAVPIERSLSTDTDEPGLNKLYVSNIEEFRNVKLGDIAKADTVFVAGRVVKDRNGCNDWVTLL